MSRTTGIFNFASNFEVLAKAPLDAKQLVGTFADLTIPATWNGSGSVWLYNGAVVSVGSDPTPSKNGIYWLCDATNYSTSSSWVKAGSGSITGATNGLHITGSSVALGGTIIEDTKIGLGTKAFTVCGPIGGNYINVCDTNSFITINSENTTVTSSVSATLSAPAVSVLGYDSIVISSDNNIQIDFSGNGYIYDNSPTPKGILYGSSSYRNNFQSNSLVDAGYVTGRSNTINVFKQTNAGSYTANTSSDFIGAWANSTIYLPAVPKPCQKIIISDVSGCALGDIITINGNGMNINDGSTATINTDYGSVTLVNNGSFWSTVAFIN